MTDQTPEDAGAVPEGAASARRCYGCGRTYLPDAGPSTFEHTHHAQGSVTPPHESMAVWLADCQTERDEALAILRAVYEKGEPMDDGAYDGVRDCVWCGAYSHRPERHHPDCLWLRIEGFFA